VHQLSRPLKKTHIPNQQKNKEKEKIPNRKTKSEKRKVMEIIPNQFLKTQFCAFLCLFSKEKKKGGDFSHQR
jgi:hypothetical protein